MTIRHPLAGKTALVTGGGSGLGREIAVALHEAGATVVIGDIDTVAAQGTAVRHGFTFAEHDVSNEANWSRTIADIEAGFGKLDILVNNAGVIGPVADADPERTSLADWRTVFTVNVEGTFLGCRAALPAMRRAGGGAIVNLSSIAALTATPFAMAYGASKAAVLQMTRSVAQHCAEVGLNVRCNSVHPGNVRTELWEKVAEARAHMRGISKEAIFKETESRSPMEGFTTAQDVAAAVLFLASDAARRITGTQLVVDGGTVGCDTFHMSQRYRDLVRESGRSA